MLIDAQNVNSGLNSQIALSDEFWEWVGYEEKMSEKEQSQEVNN